MHLFINFLASTVQIFTLVFMIMIYDQLSRSVFVATPYIIQNSGFHVTSLHCVFLITEVLYRVILSVLAPKKCEYLKDYSLDF